MPPLAAMARVAVAALTARGNVRFGGFALAAAAALGSWKALGVAVGAYLALVAVDVASPSFRARILAPHID